MTLTFDDIEFVTDIPDLPDSVPLYELSTPSLRDREPAMDRFSERFEIPRRRSIELPASVLYASERGELEYFHPSGGVWADNYAHDQRAPNELREWNELREVSRGDESRFELSERVTRRLTEEAEQILEEAGLRNEHLSNSQVALDQVAQLDAEGRVLQEGAGKGRVRFDYAVDGTKVLGPGAKSIVMLEPTDDDYTFTGAFHVWRDIEDDIGELELAPIEESLRVGLLRDPELNRYQEQGHLIEVDRLEFGYYAVPAVASQRNLLPIFEIEGRVFDPEGESQFNFGRYHQVATPEELLQANASPHYHSIAG